MIRAVMVALMLSACGNIEPPQPDAGVPELSCDTDADCPSGICEGQGCGFEGGVCASDSRVCTFDLRAYCSCDGSTFLAPSSCPGERYISLGECARD